MPATNTATESAPPATVTRYVGVCQICEAEHKLTTDAFPSLGIFGEAYKVVHHGYRRPGHGSIEGDCDGVGEVPFEISCEATKRYLAQTIMGREHALRRLASLRDGEVTELHVRSWQRGARAEVVRVGDSMWPRELASKIREVEYEIGQAEQEIARLDAMVARWAPLPLRTVDEFEGPKRDAKAAAKAKREQDYQDRTEAKIASYRKRLAVAVKNRTTSTIADIFESAPRRLGDRGLTRAQAYEAIGGAEIFAAFGLDVTAGCDFRGANADIVAAMRYGRWDPTAQRTVFEWPASLADAR